MTEATTKQLLANLNVLRTIAGLKPLTAWKDSRAKLHAALDKLDPKTPAANVAPQSDPTTKTPQPTPEALAKATTGKILEAARAMDAKAKLPSATKKLREHNVTKGEGVTLVSLCEKLGMNQKVARAKLRRAEPPFQSLSEASWVFAAKDVEAVTAFLKGDARKKS